MKRTSFNLTENQYICLRAESIKTGAPMGELLRRAIDKYIKLNKLSIPVETEEKQNGAQSNEPKR